MLCIHTCGTAIYKKSLRTKLGRQRDSVLICVAILDSSIGARPRGFAYRRLQDAWLKLSEAELQQQGSLIAHGLNSAENSATDAAPMYMIWSWLFSVLPHFPHDDL